MKDSFKLTPEQQAKVQPWADRWHQISMSTEPMTDQERGMCAEAALELYANAKLDAPQHVIFCPSPMWAIATAGMNMMEKEIKPRHFKQHDHPSLEHWFTAPWLAALKKSIPLANAIRDAIGGWQGGNLWPSYAAYVTFCRYVVKLKRDYTPWHPWQILAIHSGPRIMTQNAVYICDRPEKYVLDANKRPHCTDDHYIRWRDGSGFCAWRGLRIPAWIVLDPERLNPKVINKEANTELRRVMIEKYGTQRYIMESGAKLIHEDDWGKLFRLEQKNDEPIVMVQVVNSTMEEDGTFKNYFLLVHPELRPMRNGQITGEPQAMTARNAVASTFGLRGEEYLPIVQS